MLVCACACISVSVSVSVPLSQLSDYNNDVTFTRMRSRTDIRKKCTKFSMALCAELNLGTGCLHKSITLAKLVQKNIENYENTQ